ncbi:MAG: DEAD/DEAH box helicase, partial [Caulobacteraceae bacterium]|nr:DEAD/DEAH box helicase [Caulobacteraceae bacterium]
NVPEAYVHRIGRTARAGAQGVAITLCDRAEIGLLRDIEKLTRLSIPAEDLRADRSAPARPQAAQASAKKKLRRRRPRGGQAQGAAQPGAAQPGAAVGSRPQPQCGRPGGARGGGRKRGGAGAREWRPSL